MKKLFLIGFSILMMLSLALPVLAQDDEVPQRLILATTTSTQDSGLLDEILPIFEDMYNAEVDVIAVGTGQAIALGEAGDADVILVHARAREDAFVEDGFGTERYDVMYNDFVILGPENDPAGIADAETAADAFSLIAESESTFVSRGDDSGTHTKERNVWALTDIPEPEGDWYISAGQGMGTVISMTDELQAYTLSDRGTYIARAAEGLDLVVLFEGDPELANPYGVIPVNPELHPTINAELAQQFVDWLISLETQELIEAYTVNDQQLFFADSESYREMMEEMEAMEEGAENTNDTDMENSEDSNEDSSESSESTDS